MKIANIRNTAGNAIVEFDKNVGTFLTPRGRYNITLYDSFCVCMDRGMIAISNMMIYPDCSYCQNPMKSIKHLSSLWINPLCSLQTNMELREINVNLDEGLGLGLGSECFHL